MALAQIAAFFKKKINQDIRFKTIVPLKIYSSEKKKFTLALLTMLNTEK